MSVSTNPEKAKSMQSEAVPAVPGLPPAPVYRADQLADVTAAQLMHENVKMVYEGWSIKKLAEFFKKHQINGAPVISSDHKLVGVVSVTDILDFNSQGAGEKKAMISRAYYEEYIGQADWLDDMEQLVDRADEWCTVHGIMTPDVVSVSDNTRLPEVASVLRKFRIHRVFVTRNDRIIGVISTTDVLGALVNI